MKIAIIALVAVLVLAGGYILLKGGKAPEVASPSGTPVETLSPLPSPSADAVSPVKTFTIEGGNFKFTPSSLIVNKGDTVKIIFNNVEGFHDWVLDEFNAKTLRLKSGESATVQFVADRTGTFEYYCSVGTHRQMGMKGNLIVQ